MPPSPRWLSGGCAGDFRDFSLYKTRSLGFGVLIGAAGQTNEGEMRGEKRKRK